MLRIGERDLIDHFSEAFLVDDVELVPGIQELFTSERVVLACGSDIDPLIGTRYETDQFRPWGKIVAFAIDLEPRREPKSIAGSVVALSEGTQAFQNAFRPDKYPVPRIIDLKVDNVVPPKAVYKIDR